MLECLRGFLCCHFFHFFTFGFVEEERRLIWSKDWLLELISSQMEKEINRRCEFTK